MKKSLVTKLGGAALVLSLVTASLVGGTFAKYTKTVAGTATGTIAAFDITMDNSGGALFNLGTALAPGGAVGSGNIVLTSGSDMDMEVALTIATAAGSAGIPNWLTFGLYEEGGTIPVSGWKMGEATKLSLPVSAEAKTYVLKWTSADDTIDVTTAIAGGTLNLNITAVATQVTPAP